MFYITSDKVNFWYPVKANNLRGAKIIATNTYASDAFSSIKVGKSTECGIQCVSKKIGKCKWVDLK